MTKKRIYFGHPINTYDTPLEKFLLQKIQERFPDHEIENPNHPRHKKEYERWKNENGNGMNYFHREVLPNCDEGIFLPFMDGKWDAGVFSEASHFKNFNQLIWKITHKGVFIGLSTLIFENLLTVEETRARLYIPNGAPIPYDLKMSIPPVLEEHHEKKVWVSKNAEAARKESCLCLNCGNLKPNQTDNCPIADSFFKICKDQNVALAVTRCPLWKPPLILKA
jgi:hypothetical protein